MNIDFGELFKRVTSLLVVLGVLLILVASIGTLPIGNQPGFAMDLAWRYFLAVCGISLILTGIFFIFRESKISSPGFGNDGQTNKITFLQEFPASYKKDLESANEVWMIGSTLGKTIRDNYDILKTKLQNGGNVRVLLVHPSGAPLNMLAARYLSPVNQKPETQAARIHEVIENFISLKKLTPDRLQIRTIEYPLSYGAIVINPTQTSGILYIEHYPFRTVSGSLPKFVLKASEGQWYELYVKELRALWEHGNEWKFD